MPNLIKLGHENAVSHAFIIIPNEHLTNQIKGNKQKHKIIL